MIQQPRLPSTGQMSAIDVHIRAKEVISPSILCIVLCPACMSTSDIVFPALQLINNRDTLVGLLAKHTGNVSISFHTYFGLLLKQVLL